MRSNSDPVWVLFHRRTFARLAYWLRVLGYDLRDRSFNNRIYFVYFSAFWLAWGVGVFAILGSSLAKAFDFLPAISPQTLVIQSGAFILAAWGLMKFGQFIRRSPFVFSEPDAYLVCQTPVSRRKVGLAWFLMDWFRTALPFAAGAILLAFALTNIALSGASDIQDLPAYFAASLRAAAIILPLQMGLQAGLYALGAWRLRRDRLTTSVLWLRITVILLGIGLLAALIYPSWRSVFLTPIIIPLQAAFGSLASPTGWLLWALAVLYLLLGIASLLAGTSRMHLGQAAQETRMESVIRQANTMMNSELVENLKQRSKISATRASNKLRVKKGIWVLIWKDLIQSWRSLRFSQITKWAYIFILSLGVFLLSDWGARLILGGFWMVVLGGLVTDRLRNNLSNWWLLRSLPFSNSTLLLALLGPTSVLGIILGWLALALSSPLTAFDWLAAALLPFLVACAALGTARDILSHVKPSVLLEPSVAAENVPRQDIQGVALTLISIGLPLGLLTWSSSQPSGMVLGALSLPIAVLFTVLLFRSTVSRFLWIK